MESREQRSKSFKCTRSSNGIDQKGHSKPNGGDYEICEDDDDDKTQTDKLLKKKSRKK